MLQLKNTPGFTGDNLVMTCPQDKQVGQYCNAHGFLTAVGVPADLVLAQSQARFQFPIHQLDVIVTTHKTIDLVFHTQVHKLKRNMTRQHAASASSVVFMHNDGMEVNDESPAHSPTADCGRPIPVGAPPRPRMSERVMSGKLAILPSEVEPLTQVCGTPFHAL